MFDLFKSFKNSQNTYSIEDIITYIYFYLTDKNKQVSKDRLYYLMYYIQGSSIMNKDYHVIKCKDVKIIDNGFYNKELEDTYNKLVTYNKRVSKREKKKINNKINSMDKTLIDMIIRKMDNFTDNELLVMIQKELPYKKALKENKDLNLYDMYSYFSRKEV